MANFAGFYCICTPIKRVWIRVYLKANGCYTELGSLFEQDVIGNAKVGLLIFSILVL